ncbi:MAG TPA: FtsW/RodA/SpoVE family cell cycle protein [Candidatus Krumholzibacteria bacterium]|nr:FtsW/RodA/SpoVE family cell cycle protein [Candidatus Krumholzibacteria bacterium]
MMRRIRTLAAGLEGGDPYLGAAVAVLLFIGIPVVWGAGSFARGASASPLGPHYILAKHLFMIALGLGVMVALASLDYRIMRKRWLARAALVGSLLLVAWTLRHGPGLLTHHICRWVNIAGFQLQPVEPAKLAAIAVMAELLTRNGTRAPDDRHVLQAMAWGFAPLAALLVLQPNFGNVLVITGVTLVMLFVAGMRLRLLGLITMLPAGGMALAFAVVPKLRHRLVAWIGALADGQYQYQVKQSIIGLGAGGLRGLGPGQSHNKFSFLPESHTDFAFSVLGEEWGLFGALLVIAMIVVIAWRGYGIAARATDAFGRVTAAGLTTTLVIYAVANIGMVTGLLPVIGVPLPFVSYGGTAMIGALAAIGILMSIERTARARDVEHQRLRRRGGLA